MIRIGPTEENILRNLTDSISERLNTTGIFNRVFSRIKSKSSIEKKLIEKNDIYISEGKKLQDVFGIRVTLYFLDDEKIAINLIKNLFEEIPDSHSIDIPNKETFGPVRNNLVFKIDDKLRATSSLFDQELIDATFEIQFRTIFSEGWHEVEHDLRYKCKKDWEDENILSRQLNGQLAALETSDWAILKIFDEIAYKKYKNRDWNSFFRNVLRIRFEDTKLNTQITQTLDQNPSIAKVLLRIDREKLILPLTMVTKKLPLKMDNVFFIINRVLLKNSDLLNLEEELLTKILDESFPQENTISQILTS